MGWPVNNDCPKITMGNGFQIALYFGALPIPGAFGFAVCYRGDASSEWMGAMADPNFDSSILGDKAKWNAWLAAQIPVVNRLIHTVYHAMPLLAADYVPKTTEEVSIWLDEHAALVMAADGYPVVSGK